MPRLLRVAEAAAQVGLSERTLRRLIAEGRLTVLRPAALRVVLIPEEALSELTTRGGGVQDQPADHQAVGA